MVLFTFPLLLAWSLAAVVAKAAIIRTGSTVLLNNVPYFIPPRSVAVLKLLPGRLNGNDFTPLTVIEVNEPTFDQAELQGQVQNYTAVDDVWQEGFLECMLYELSEKPFSLSR